MNSHADTVASDPHEHAPGGSVLAPWRAWAALWALSALVWWIASLPIELAVLCVVAVAVHELGHFATARCLGIRASIAIAPAAGVTLLEREPQTVRGQLVVIGAGPAANLGLAGLCVGQENSVGMLGVISLVMALVNLLPIPLLDGGRLFLAVTQGSTPARTMCRTIISTGGTSLAAALGFCAAIRGDYVGAGTFILMAAGAAAIHGVEWRRSARCFGARTFGRWVTCGMVAAMPVAAAYLWAS